MLLKMPNTAIDGILRFLNAESLWEMRDLNRHSYSLFTTHERKIVREVLVSLLNLVVVA